MRGAMKHKDFIEIHDYSADEVREIFEIARDMKSDPEKYREALKGQTLAMIFEKSSTRSRDVPDGRPRAVPVVARHPTRAR